MEHTQVAAGGDGLQIWRLAANVLNKQSRTADRGWSSSLAVGEGLTTINLKNSNLIRNIAEHHQGVDGRMGSKWTLGRVVGGSVEWIHLAQERDRWRAVVSAVMNLRVLGPRS
jgi:hypothetical protein